jgi:hypothetical protein
MTKMEYGQDRHRRSSYKIKIGSVRPHNNDGICDKPVWGKGAGLSTTHSMRLKKGSNMGVTVTNEKF